MPLCDPHEILALAGRIDRHADAVRATAHRLGFAVAATTWDGRAARCFDGTADDLVRGLRLAATRLDDAADTLRRHAHAVAGTLATLHRLAGDGRHLLHDSAHGALDVLGAQLDPLGVVGPGAGALVHDGGRLAGDAAHLGRDAGHLAGHLAGSALHVIGL